MSGASDTIEEDNPFVVENQIFMEHDYAGWTQHTSLVDHATARLYCGMDCTESVAETEV